MEVGGGEAELVEHIGIALLAQPDLVEHAGNQVERVRPVAGDRVDRVLVHGAGVDAVAAALQAGEPVVLLAGDQVLGAVHEQVFERVALGVEAGLAVQIQQLEGQRPMAAGIHRIHPVDAEADPQVVAAEVGERTVGGNRPAGGIGGHRRQHRRLGGGLRLALLDIGDQGIGLLGPIARLEEVNFGESRRSARCLLCHAVGDILEPVHPGHDRQPVQLVRVEDVPLAGPVLLVGHRKAVCVRGLRGLVGAECLPRRIHHAHLHQRGGGQASGGGELSAQRPQGSQAGVAPARSGLLGQLRHGATIVGDHHQLVDQRRDDRGDPGATG